MKALRTPQRVVPVRVLLEDGRTVEGGFYAPAAGPDGGPGRLLDRLNDGLEEFVPLAGRYETLISKAWMVTIQLPGDQEDAEGIESEVAREQRVRITLPRGKVVEGWIRYLMPEERGRLLDYLNTAPHFIPLVGENRITLVNRRFIVSVQELTALSAVK
ncbi:MAG: hypothetical protein ACE5NW_11325 [Acidiferrobacterales bacterium]